MLSRLELLRRGRGAGFVAALADPDGGRADVLTCLVDDDPERDSQVEHRSRYLAELVERLDVPLAPVAAYLAAGHAAGRDWRLGHQVLGDAWRRGHGPTRALFAGSDLADATLDRVVGHLYGSVDADELPPRVAARLREYERTWGVPSEEPPPTAPPANASVAELLAVAQPRRDRERTALLEALLARVTVADRALLATAAADERDASFGAASLAIEALGALGDARLLPDAECCFATEFVFGGPRRWALARRFALLHYVKALPAAIALPLARAWRDRPNYFSEVVSSVLARHAEPADREWIEDRVRGEVSVDRGWSCGSWIPALERLADPRSVPLLADVAANVVYSYARERALRALARRPDAPAAGPALREALWDAHDDAVAAACTVSGPLDTAARQRLAELAADPLLEPAVRALAAQRLAAE